MKITKLLVGLLILMMCVGVASAFNTYSKANAPSSALVYNGTTKVVKFNCTVTINGTWKQTLVNITFWTNFDGTWKRNATANFTTNNTAKTFNQTLPTTQGSYLWNCKYSTNKSTVKNINVNATNLSTIIDTTAPTLTLTAGTSTVPNGSVLIAGLVDGIYLTVADSGGSTVSEKLSYSSTNFTNASGTNNFIGSWNSTVEGVLKYDFATALKYARNHKPTMICAKLNLTDQVGNDRRKVKYCFNWTQDPAKYGAKKFNFSLYGGTNLSKINVSAAGAITPITVSIKNNYGEVTWTSVTFTGYDTDFDDCTFAQDSLMCDSDMGLTTTAATIKFKNISGFSTEPKLYKDGVEFAGTGISWVAASSTYSATVSGFSTYTLMSSISGGSGGAGGAGGYAVCGDGVCSIPMETPENCAMDCGQASIPVPIGQSPTTVNNDGFIPLSTVPTTPAATEETDNHYMGWIIFGGTGIFVLIGIFIIICLMPTKGKRRRK